MANILLVIALFGSVALARAEPDCATTEWTGKPWLGKWKSTDRHENFAAFAEAWGLRSTTPKTTYQEMWKVGEDYYHSTSVPDGNFTEEFKFRLGDGADIQAIRYLDAPLGGPMRAWEYQETDGKLVSDVTVGEKTRHVEIEVQGDEYIYTIKFGEVVAKRWYTRVPNSCA